MTPNNINLSQLLAEAKPTLVEFYRPGCAKCEESLATLEQLRQRLADKANVVAVDGTANQDLMKAYKVDSYPTYVLFKYGAVAWKDSGAKPFGELEHMVRDFI